MAGSPSGQKRGGSGCFVPSKAVATTTPGVDAASVAIAAPRHATVIVVVVVAVVVACGAIVTVAQRLTGDGDKGEGPDHHRQRHDLATRQEACNPNCAIVREALAGNSFLAGPAVSRPSLFPRKVNTIVSEAHVAVAVCRQPLPRPRLDFLVPRR